MCGICFTETLCELDQVPVKTSRLLNRGPDAYGCHHLNAENGLSGLLHGCVLVLRHHLVQQPLTDTEDNALVWNGEIFGGIEVSGLENDGSVLLDLLTQAKTQEDIIEIFGRIQGPWAFIYWQNKTQTLWFGRDIFGRRSLLWSLPKTKVDVFALSSISLDPLNWKEVPAAGIYAMNCKDEGRSIKLFPWGHLPACSNLEDATSGMSSICDHVNDSYFSFEKSASVIPVCLQTFNVSVPADGDLSSLDASCSINSNGTQNETTQSESVRTSELEMNEGRTKIAIKTTSSDVTSSAECMSMTTCSTKLSSSSSKHVKSLPTNCGGASTSTKQSIGDSFTAALNVEPTGNVPGILDNMLTIPKQIGGSVDVSNTCSSISQSVSKFDHVDVKGSHKKCHKEINIEGSDTKALQARGGKTMNSQYLLEIASAGQLEVVHKFLLVLSEAVRVRVQNQMEYCNVCLKLRLSSQGSGDEIRCGHSRVGVLFSGGIDSLMIAALADRFVPENEPIDLMNVAFQLQPKLTNHQGKKTKHTSTSPANDFDPYLVPDRITGLSGLEELKALNPKRKWNFVEVNITVEELKTMRDDHICHLVYPLQTVLDDSIGCAVWFAARGVGLVQNTEVDGKTLFRSTARVLLVGMGADEQLGGYSRHRNAFKRAGWSGLAEELQMEINRISERNLGRDDRIITDHGKESRFPFLDENVVSFLNSLPIWQKADLRLERGFGEKIILRQCAALLGLCKSAVLPKRAIQFGSRIAKVEDRKEKASDVCKRLKKLTVSDS